MKNILQYCLVLVFCVLSQSLYAADKISATIVKDGTYTPITFEANRPVPIPQSDTPVAIQFEKVDENWSVTLFETKTYRLTDLRNSDSVFVADAIIVTDENVMLLDHIRTYEACPYSPDARLIWFGTYNFSIRVDCPTAPRQTRG